MTSAYPIDFEAVQRGDEFTPEKLADIVGKKPGTDAFRFAVLGLQSLIQRRTMFTVKGLPDGGLRVLTDPEAAEHNERMFQQNLRGLSTRAELNRNVDIELLSDDQRNKHVRVLMSQSRYVSAINRTTKWIRTGVRDDGEQDQLRSPERTAIADSASLCTSCGTPMQQDTPGELCSVCAAIASLPNGLEGFHG